MGYDTGIATADEWCQRVAINGRFSGQALTRVRCYVQRWMQKRPELICKIEQLGKTLTISFSNRIRPQGSRSMAITLSSLQVTEIANLEGELKEKYTCNLKSTSVLSLEERATRRVTFTIET